MRETLALELAEDVRRPQEVELLLADVDGRRAVLGQQDRVADGDLHGDELPALVHCAGADGDDVGVCRTFENPWIVGKAMEVDLAFASVETSATGSAVKFFMPTTEEVEFEPPRHMLTDAREVVFDDLRFSHFVGTKRG